MNYVLLSLVCGVVVVLLVILLRMFLKQRRFGVPFVRSKSQCIDLFIDHLHMSPRQTFLDLWCGDGVVMAAVLEKFPEVYAKWYEFNPEVCALSQEFQKKYGKRFVIKNTDFFKEDFSEASVIYCYLLPRILKRVWKKIMQECIPWTHVYTYVFPLKDIAPIKQIQVPVPWKKDDILYVYLI